MSKTTDTAPRPLTTEELQELYEKAREAKARGLETRSYLDAKSGRFRTVIVVLERVV